MADLHTPLHTPTHPIRLVTASALFDGHDASINIMRRILQASGAEVIHLGHNRSVPRFRTVSTCPSLTSATAATTMCLSRSPSMGRGSQVAPDSTQPP